MKKLTYIWHDCFVFEDKTNIIVFDFWQDLITTDDGIPFFIKNADKSKKLFVIVSHHHKDHFTNKIFEWEEMFFSITYIISKDVARHARHILRSDSIYSGKKPNPQNVIILSPGEAYSSEDFKIEAFRSTDIGNSYVVESGETILFHAGDLNAWIWKDESSEKEILTSISKFNVILESIYERFPSFDIAMFPVDPRIGTNYFEGARIFVRKFNIKHFFPMHFCLWENDREKLKFKFGATDFRNYANTARGEYIALTSPYDCMAF